MPLQLFATVPRGMEPLLAGELRALGAHGIVQRRAGVSFSGRLDVALRVCLWSRLASRVLLALADGPAADGEQLYQTVRTVDWRDHLARGQTLAVDFTGSSDGIRDTRFGAVRVKDAVVDQLRERWGERPSVDARDPDVRLNCHLERGRVSVALDLSGDSLHRRGYRPAGRQAEAPLKENLAAAVLLFAEWPRLATDGAAFLDPLCGSGTLSIEAALIAADIAPGLLRAQAGRFGLLRWQGRDEGRWRELVREAEERREAGLGRLRAAQPGLLRAADHDAAAIRLAGEALRRAGLEDLVRLQRADLQTARPEAAAGLLATNPPYGERLGERDEAAVLVALLGRVLRERFGGWRAAVLAGDAGLAAALELPPLRDLPLYNGPLKVTVRVAEVRPAPGGATQAAQTARPRHGPASSPSPSPSAVQGTALLSSGAEQFANRLHKNRRRLARLVRREDLTCYRLYDADLPDFNLVIDLYGDWAQVQEYAPPAQIDPAKARRRLDEALAVVAGELQLPADHIVLKQRRRQRGAEQYGRREERGALLSVQEDGLTYLVDLHSYLDTGFFIDQRLTRRLVRRLAPGARFLNLFAYTGTMTVNALAAGAVASTSIDLSATYLDWAARNLRANGLDASGSQQLVRADVLQWITEDHGEFDLVWLDPPTFSNSKRMGRATFDVQRDHADLIRLVCRRLLAPGGTLLFASNRRGFRLDHEAAGLPAPRDLSRSTLPPDCARSAPRHHVYSFRPGDEGRAARKDIPDNQQ